jgi:hypothetical protein
MIQNKATFARSLEGRLLLKRDEVRAMLETKLMFQLLQPKVQQRKVPEAD